MDISETYEKFIKAVENEEYTKLGETVGYSVLELAEVNQKHITFEQLKNIIYLVLEDDEILNMINDSIQEELSKIPESEVER